MNAEGISAFAEPNLEVKWTQSNGTHRQKTVPNELKFQISFHFKLEFA